MLPFGVEHFPQSSSGQDQQTNRRDRMASELAIPILGLGGVLGLRFRLVDRVGQAGRFCGCQSLAEAQKLRIGQVPFPGALPVFLDVLGRVVDAGNMLLLRRPAPNCREDGKRPVACGRRSAMLAWRRSTSA